jgi:cytochrome b6-f complex iron-sulfur subunit
MSQDDECGCNRREVLYGIGIATAGGVIAVGCGGGGDSGPDAATGSDGSGGTGVTMCGNNLCVDLNDPANAMLAVAGGSKVVNAPQPAGKLIVVQQPANTFVAMAAICTHAGCTVGYTKSLMQIVCPCHGSHYALDGSVVQGPATRDLKLFTTSVAGNVLTITLS